LHAASGVVSDGVLNPRWASTDGQSGNRLDRVRPLLSLSMFGAKPGFLNAETGDPETNRLIASLPPDAAEIHFTFETEDWLTIVGVASRMKHEHRRFCVDDGLAFTFGEDNLCQQLTG